IRCSRDPGRWIVRTMRKDTISVRLLQEALLGFTRFGQSAEALLAELGFAQLPLHQPDERISVDHYSAVWLRLAAAHDDEFFGMDPRPLRVGSFSFLCRTGISQPTVGQKPGSIHTWRH